MECVSTVVSVISHPGVVTTTDIVSTEQFEYD